MRRYHGEMQFRADQKRAIAAGKLRRSIRNWRRAQVKPGGRYAIRPFGFIRVDEVGERPFDSLREADAREAGVASLADLAALLTRGGGVPERVYDVRFTFDGRDDPNAPLTEARDPADIAAACDRLDGIDARAGPGAWAWKALELIERNPGRRAADLAALLGLERDDFKARIRRLKRLGLTHSLEVGYRVSALGAACLGARR